MDKQFSYRLPRICAKCAAREGTQEYQITSEKTSYYVVARRTRTFKFKVMVCEMCIEALNELKKRRTRIIGVAVLIGAAAGIAVALINGGSPDNVQNGATMLAILGALVGFLAGYFVSSIKVGDELNLGKYDGKYFEFSNAEYHRQFAALNPLITKARKT